MDLSKRVFANIQSLSELFAIILLAAGVVYVSCITVSESHISAKSSQVNSGSIFLLQHTERFSKDERRIAHHFETDTLPGLMRRGLVKKYSRSESGTILQVEGKIWKKRSYFFKESLLTEILVYNKVNGYGFATVIVDNYSNKLYARAFSEDRKIIFD
jgi:hypothetical protein